MPPINFLVLTASISSLSLSLHLFIQCLESQEFASASFFERFRISLTSFSLDSSALSPFSGRLFSLVFHSFFLATGLIKETVEKNGLCRRWDECDFSDSFCPCFYFISSSFRWFFWVLIIRSADQIRYCGPFSTSPAHPSTLTNRSVN